MARDGYELVRDDSCSSGAAGVQRGCSRGGDRRKIHWEIALYLQSVADVETQVSRLCFDEHLPTQHHIEVSDEITCPEYCPAAGLGVSVGADSACTARRERRGERSGKGAGE
jgi:hypothetical protein